ncbi:hypothetical protein VP01_6045g3, partial [Puccinia sorghi]
MPVYDLIVVGQTKKFEELFLARFPNSTAHYPDTLLGMNLNINADSIELLQPGLIKKGLEMLNLSNCKPVKTPLTPAVQLHTATEEDHQAFLKLKLNYRSFTGMLNYLACRTRPDLAAAVSILSKFNQRPGMSHWQEGFCYGRNQINLLIGSTSLLMQPGQKIMNPGYLEQETEKYHMSSTESEMSALSDGEQENLWLSFLIEELWKI